MTVKRKKAEALFVAKVQENKEGDAVMLSVGDGSVSNGSRMLW